MGISGLQCADGGEPGHQQDLRRNHNRPECDRDRWHHQPSTVVAFSDAAGAMAVNPITNQIYIAVGNDVTVLTEQQVQPIPLLTKITPLTGNQTTSRTPSFSFQTTSTYAPVTPTPVAVYFQVDTWQGPWTRASGSNPAFSGQTGTLVLGTHILFAYASDGQDAGINGDAFGGQVTIGEIAAYPFTVHAGFDCHHADRGCESFRAGWNGDADGDRDSDRAGHWHAHGNGHLFRWYNRAWHGIPE